MSEESSTCTVCLKDKHKAVFEGPMGKKLSTCSACRALKRAYNLKYRRRRVELKDAAAHWVKFDSTAAFIDHVARQPIENQVVKAKLKQHIEIPVPPPNQTKDEINQTTTEMVSLIRNIIVDPLEEKIPFLWRVKRTKTSREQRTFYVNFHCYQDRKSRAKSQSRGLRKVVNLFKIQECESAFNVTMNYGKQILTATYHHQHHHPMTEDYVALMKETLPTPSTEVMKQAIHEGFPPPPAKVAHPEEVAVTEASVSLIQSAVRQLPPLTRATITSPPILESTPPIDNTLPPIRVEAMKLPPVRTSTATQTQQ